MLISGNKILAREDGTERNVTDLSISDLIFDPILSKYVEISDILAREIELIGDIQKYFAPIAFEKDSFELGMPSRWTQVTPQQHILLPQTEKRDGFSRFRQTEARFLNDYSTRIEPSLGSQIKLFAIFCDEQRYAKVDGMIVPLFSPDVYF